MKKKSGAFSGWLTKIIMETSVTISEKDSAFNVLFYQNPFPAWIVETNTLRVVAVNDAAVRQYGYEREEFLKNTISLLNLPEEDESFNTLLKKLEHNQAVKKQLTHLKKDGTPVYVNVTSYSIQFCNCCCGMIMVNGIAEKCRGAIYSTGILLRSKTWHLLIRT